jgi:hypothetical protein
VVVALQTSIIIVVVAEVRGENMQKSESESRLPDYQWREKFPELVAEAEAAGLVLDHEGFRTERGEVIIPSGVSEMPWEGPFARYATLKDAMAGIAATREYFR